MLPENLQIRSCDIIEPRFFGEEELRHDALVGLDRNHAARSGKRLHRRAPAKAGIIASRNGSDMHTPAPRKKVRRERALDEMQLPLLMKAAPFGKRE